MTVGKLARRQHKRPIWLSPEQVRGVIERCPKHRAAGIDGLPSNVFHMLTFDHYQQLADTFNEILNSPWEPCYSRPPDWDHSSVSLLPKVAKCTQLPDFRPIALISQWQKVWERLLADLIAPNMEGSFGDFQYGFRKGRQCALRWLPRS